MKMLAWFVALFWPIGVAGAMTAVFICAMFVSWRFFNSKIGERFCKWLFDEQPTQAFSFIRVKYILFNEGGIHMKQILTLLAVGGIAGFFLGGYAVLNSELQDEVEDLRSQLENKEEESE